MHGSQKREGDKKATSGDGYNWNTLFVRADTVATATAAAHGITKGEVLDPVRCAGVWLMNQGDQIDAIKALLRLLLPTFLLYYW